MRVAGADGCPGGWMVIEADIDPRPGQLGARQLGAQVMPTLEPVVDRVRNGSVQALAIDMPIGLLDDRSRASDRLARQLLGVRRASVFPTPVRATLGATDYDDACRRSRSVSGKALSKQAFHLLPKIRQLDELLTPSDQDRIVEAHPECAFARLNGGPLEWAKATVDGRTARAGLLVDVFGSDAVDRVVADSSAPITDVHDALSLVVTAAHVVQGTAIRLGDEIDSTGKRAEIVY